MEFKSFDVVSSVIEEANKRFSKLYKPVPEKIDILKEYCEAIDGIIKEYEGEEFECSIDEIKMTVTIRFTITDVVVNDPMRDAFQHLIARSILFRVSREDDNHICVEYVFPKLWEKI